VFSHETQGLYAIHGTEARFIAIEVCSCLFYLCLFVHGFMFDYVNDYVYVFVFYVLFLFFIYSCLFGYLC